MSLQVDICIVVFYIYGSSFLSCNICILCILLHFSAVLSRGLEHLTRGLAAKVSRKISGATDSDICILSYSHSGKFPENVQTSVKAAAHLSKEVEIIHNVLHDGRNNFKSLGVA